MSDLHIKKPPGLYRKPKRVAAKNRRTVAGRVLALLGEASTKVGGAAQLHPPVKGKVPLTQSFLDRAKRSGRA